MEPFVARALMNRLLSASEQSDLEKYEAWLQTQPKMLGRYLTAWELCQRYHLKLEAIPDIDIERMSSLLWIWEKKQEELYAEGETKHGVEPFNIHGDDYLANLRHWGKFAQDNYEHPSRFDQ